MPEFRVLLDAQAGVASKISNACGSSLPTKLSRALSRLNYVLLIILIRNGPDHDSQEPVMPMRWIGHVFPLAFVDTSRLSMRSGDRLSPSPEARQDKDLATPLRSRSKS
jgi:hypothetical protein